MNAGWAENLANVTKGLLRFFQANKSKWFPLGTPVLTVGDVEVPFTAGGYARRDEGTKKPFLGVVVLRSSFPERTPTDEALRNLGSLIHHTQQRRMRDQLFGEVAHRMPNVELLLRMQAAGARVGFDHLTGERIDLMTEVELERLLTVFLEALDILGSRRISVLKAKYGPKRPGKRPEGPDLFDPPG